MFNQLSIVMHAITIIYREGTLPNKSTTKNNSKDLVKNILGTMKSDKISKLSGGDSEIHAALKDLLTDMTSTDDGYDKLTLTQTIKLITTNKPELADVLLDTIKQDLDLKSTIETIRNLKKVLNNYYRYYQLKNKVTMLSYKLNSGKLSPSEINDILEELGILVDSLNIKINIDSGSKIEVDLGDQDTLAELMESVKDSLSSKGALATGWTDFNEMIDGGFKRGEFVMLGALQHQYKSGTMGTIFASIPRFNKPMMLDPEKKPLILLHSLEDDARVVLNFLYNHLYYDEFEKHPEMAGITSKEMAKYIAEKLAVNGYNVRIIRDDPTKLTYKDIISIVTDFEADGFEVHAYLCDYLSLIPTTGCIQTGAMGTDLRDLFRRVRNFCASQHIAFITPHQLSTEAKMMIRDSDNDVEFVKRVQGKGYLSNSKQLDQEVDLEIYQHIGKFRGKTVLSFARGKHRGAPILDEKKKYLMMFFPEKSPIPTDVGREVKVSHRPGISKAEEDEAVGGLDF